MRGAAVDSGRGRVAASTVILAQRGSPTEARSSPPPIKKQKAFAAHERVESLNIHRKKYACRGHPAQMSCCSFMMSLNWRPSFSAALRQRIMRFMNISK